MISRIVVIVSVSNGVRDADVDDADIGDRYY